MQIQHTINGSQSTNGYVLFDGLGREIAKVNANGESTPYDRIDTCYDGLGRKSRVSIHINLVQRVPPVVRAHLREIATLTTL